MLLMMVFANEYTKENHTTGGQMVDKSGHQVGMASMEALQKHDGLLDMPVMKPAALNAIKDIHMPVQWYHCLCTTAMVKEHAALMNSNDWKQFGVESKCTTEKARKRQWIPCMPGKMHEAQFSSRVIGYLQADKASIAVYLAAPAPNGDPAELFISPGQKDPKHQARIVGNGGIVLGHVVAGSGGKAETAEPKKYLDSTKGGGRGLGETRLFRGKREEGHLAQYVTCKVHDAMPF